MKIKSFLALLAAGLLCVTSFSACDDDDDSKQYSYEFIAELTDPGSMTPAEIEANDKALDFLEKNYNAKLSTVTLSPDDAKRNLNNVVKEFKAGMAGEPNTLTKPVTITFSMKNKSLGKIEFTSVITIEPAK